MKTEHTPTPWAAKCVGSTGSVDVYEIATERRQVAEYISEADAKFIVRAVNSYADMLAALEAAREELRLIHMKDRNTVYQPGLGVMIDMAIRRAKGEG